MANTFLHAQGLGIGKSLAEKDLAGTAREILDEAGRAGCAIILPVDATVAWHFQANAPHQAYGLDAIPTDGMILDVGPQSIERVNARSTTPRRLSGTVRSAPSSSRPSTPARWPRRSTWRSG